MKIKKTCIFFLSIGFFNAVIALFIFFFSFLLHCKPMEACDLKNRLGKDHDIWLTDCV